MESGSIKELSEYRFGKAVSNLEISKSLFKDKHWSFALNRAYYAIFDAMRAVNALEGFDSSKHSGVIAYFNQNFVKTGKFSLSCSAIIRRASMLREKSDYEDFYTPEEEETKKTIDEVEIFINEVSEFLKNNGIL